MNRVIKDLNLEIDRESAPRYDIIPASVLPNSGRHDALREIPGVRADIAPESHLVLYNEPHSMAADRFRMLRVYLRALGERKRVKTLMVTSALPGEGKSLTALNIAIGLAENSGKTVVLVEADLRHPSLTQRLGLESWSGLTRCLADGSDPVPALRRVDQLGIYLLPAGEPAPNPIQLLNSDRLAGLLNRLRSLADWVILDSPPVIPVPDALAIRSNVDGCVWVVKSDSTPRDVVKEAIHQLGEELVLSIVLNQTEEFESAYPHYYGCSPTGMLRSAS